MADAVKKVKQFISEGSNRVAKAVQNNPDQFFIGDFMRKAQDNPLIGGPDRAIAKVAYNTLYKNIDPKAHRDQATAYKALPPQQKKAYDDKRMMDAMTTMVMGDVMPIGGQAAILTADQLRKGIEGTITPQIIKKVMAQRSIPSNTPLGKASLDDVRQSRTSVDYVDKLKNKLHTAVDQIRREGMADYADLDIAPRSGNMSRARIDEYKDIISSGGNPPPVVLNDVPNPGAKPTIFDGNHRALAYQELGLPIPIANQNPAEYKDFLDKSPQFAIEAARESVGLMPKLGIPKIPIEVLDNPKQAERILNRLKELNKIADIVINNAKNAKPDRSTAEMFGRAAGLLK